MGYTKEQLKQVVDALIKEYIKLGQPLFVVHDIHGASIPKSFCEAYKIDCCQNPESLTNIEDWDALMSAINNIAEERGYKLFYRPFRGDLMFGRIEDLDEITRREAELAVKYPGRPETDEVATTTVKTNRRLAVDNKPKYTKKDLEKVVSSLIEEREDTDHPIVVVDNAHGTYMPQVFCEHYGIDCCQNPDDEFYLEDWEDLMNVIDNIATDKGYVLTYGPSGDLMFGRISDFDSNELGGETLSYTLINLIYAGKTPLAYSILETAKAPVLRKTVEDLLRKIECALGGLRDIRKAAAAEKYYIIDQIADTTYKDVLLDPVPPSTIQAMKAKGCEILPHPICVLSKEAKGIAKEAAERQCIDEGKIHWISLAKCPIEEG